MAVCVVGRLVDIATSGVRSFHTSRLSDRHNTVNMRESALGVVD